MDSTDENNTIDLNFLTVKEVARILRVSEATVRRLIRNKRLRSFTVGEVELRVSEADLRAYLESRVTTCPAKCRDPRRRSRLKTGEK